jgi:hypothetical protein
MAVGTHFEELEGVDLHFCDTEWLRHRFISMDAAFFTWGSAG